MSVSPRGGVRGVHVLALRWILRTTPRDDGNAKEVFVRPYEILESTSELKLRIFGNNLEELFQNAVKAMFDSIAPIYAENAPLITHKIVVNSVDRELLLIDFLAEALFLSDSNNEAYYDVQFDKLTDTTVCANVFGKQVTGFAIEIKAVTHHDMHIMKKGDTLYTDIVFDI